MRTETRSTNASQTDDSDITLVVDLDGTLCRTDTLHEALLRFVASNPLEVLRLPGWLAGGRVSFKAELADRLVLDPGSLPLNDVVLAFVRMARASGRRTALVSAADHRQVTAVAETTGLFDEAYGSADGHNLKGSEKAAFLEQHFGSGHFDYMGDSKADLPVWKVARRAITVQASLATQRAAKTVNADTQHIDPPAGQARAVFNALRPHQWSKNMLLFLPMLAAQDLSKIGPVLLGFIAFCLTASAVYVMNDLLDLEADRIHPRKRKRPFAAGELPAKTGAALAAGLLLAALYLGLLTGNVLFLAILGTYLIATFVYSFYLKRKLLIDVLALAGLYTVRVIAGGAAASVILSPWMLGFSMFLFLALAAIKRQAELTDQMKTGRTDSGRAYEIEDLPILRGMAIVAGNTSVLVLALYISSDTVQALYSRPGLIWVICPLLLYWVLRLVMKTHRGQMTDDPIVFAVTDRVSCLLVISCMFIALASV